MASNDEVVMYEYRVISSELPTSIVPQNVTHVRFHPSVTLVTDIGNRAFTGRDRLREVLLNEGLKIIGVNAFKGCKLLQSIMIPSLLLKRLVRVRLRIVTIYEKWYFMRVLRRLIRMHSNAALHWLVLPFLPQLLRLVMEHLKTVLI